MSLCCLPGSDNDGRRVAVIYATTHTATHNGIDSRACLLDILTASPVSHQQNRQAPAVGLVPGRHRKPKGRVRDRTLWSVQVADVLHDNFDRELVLSGSFVAPALVRAVN